MGFKPTSLWFKGGFKPNPLWFEVGFKPNPLWFKGGEMKTKHVRVHFGLPPPPPGAPGGREGLKGGLTFEPLRRGPASTCSQHFVFLSSGSLLSQQVIFPISSFASTVPSLDDNFEHNMWNPLLDLLFLEQVSFLFASSWKWTWPRSHYLVHFALGVLCYKEGVYDSA